MIACIDNVGVLSFSRRGILLPVGSLIGNDIIDLFIITILLGDGRVC